MSMDPASFERDAFRYLLGEGTDDVRAAFETTLLDGDGLEALAAIEDELIDRHVRKELSAADEARFQQHFRTLPGREAKIAFARSLAAELGPKRSVVASRRIGPALGFR